MTGWIGETEKQTEVVGSLCVLCIVLADENADSMQTPDGFFYVQHALTIYIPRMRDQLIISAPPVDTSPQYPSEL